MREQDRYIKGKVPKVTKLMLHITGTFPRKTYHTLHAFQYNIYYKTEQPKWLP